MHTHHTLHSAHYLPEIFKPGMAESTHLTSESEDVRNGRCLGFFLKESCCTKYSLVLNPMRRGLLERGAESGRTVRRQADRFGRARLTAHGSGTAVVWSRDGRWLRQVWCARFGSRRSEEHTSELQSPTNLV